MLFHLVEWLKQFFSPVNALGYVTTRILASTLTDRKSVV